MTKIMTNTYKYALDRVIALINDNPVDFFNRYSEYPVEIIARWLQREGAMIGDELADEAAILKFSLPKMKNEFLDNFDISLTPEGGKFWKDVKEDRDLYYNIYPTVYDSDSIAEIEQKALIALRFIELNDSWDEKNSYSVEIDGFDKNTLKNLMVNQALQGNQMDFFIFQNNLNSTKEKGGFDWDNSPQGSSFWNGIEESTERDRISMFRDNDINKFAEKDIVRESNPTTTTQINTNPADLVKEIEEGENRVEYFRDTKQDSLKEFAKDFPEAEAPLNKLLDLLSIKEQGRLEKLPKKKKKKKEEKIKLNVINRGKGNITRQIELKTRLENDLIGSSKYLLSIPDSIDEQDQLPEMYNGNEYTGAINTKEELRDNIMLIAQEINEITDFLDSESKKEQEVESEVELTAKDITELIEGLELGLEYLDGNDKKDATEQIEGLKITLDYI